MPTPKSSPTGDPRDLGTILARTVARHGSRPAFGTRASDGSWSWITWSDFGARVDAFRGGLASLGVEAGDRIAVISNNRVEWAVGAYASYGLRATYVPMYEAMLDEDWAYILRDCGAKVCLVANADIERRVRALVPDLAIVVLGSGFDALSAKGRASPIAAQTPDPEEIAYFIYTSGTTGKPKGVRLTHRGLAWQCTAMSQVLPFHEDDRSLAFLPWAHVGGGATELNGIVYAGASTAVCEKTEWILEALPVVQPTVMVAVPRIWNKIYDGVHKQIAARPKPIQRLFHAAIRAHQKRARGDTLGLRERAALAIAKRLIFSKVVARFGGRLRVAGSGAAALSPEVGRFIDAIGIPVCEGYGMTEVSSLSTLNPIGAQRIGSVGRPLPGARIEIDHTAGSSEREGEIVIHGPGVMAGYHGLPDQTAATLTPDGGVRSGDLGYFDADGYLYVTGRVKEIYKLANGKYVSPAPIEERITLSPYIAQAMVHGQNEAFNVALLVPDMPALRAWAETQGIPVADDAALLRDSRVRLLFSAELDQHAPDKGYERVKDFVLVPEELSVANGMLTPTFKVKRSAVVAKHGAALNALFAT